MQKKKKTRIGQTTKKKSPKELGAPSPLPIFFYTPQRKYQSKSLLSLHTGKALSHHQPSSLSTNNPLLPLPAGHQNHHATFSQQTLNPTGSPVTRAITPSSHCKVITPSQSVYKR